MKVTGKERTELAFSGKKPDRVPVMPIYDLGYIMRMQGKCVRDFRTATRLDAIEQIIRGFSFHDVDAYFVHGITDNRFTERYSLEEIDKAGDFYIYRDRQSGEIIRMNAVGDRFHADGRPIHMTNSSFESEIRNEADIRRLVPADFPSGHFDEDGYYGPLLRLSRQHPDCHFQFQTGTPFVSALNRCGGYEAAMCMLLDEPALMMKLMEAEMELALKRLAPGKAAGGSSVLYTSYYTGADTISPKTYYDCIYPFDMKICRIAKEMGLHVAFWFLGDMNPLLHWLKEIPFDAMYPEQDRKGYGVDYRQLRSVLGEDRCICSFTWENQFVGYDQAGIRDTFAGQFDAAGRRGAFIAGNTIVPENADPRSMDCYIDAVREIGVY